MSWRYPPVAEIANTEKVYTRLPAGRQQTVDCQSIRPARICIRAIISGQKPPCNMTATYVLVIDVGAYYGVSRSYIFRCLKEIPPERRRQMVQSISVLGAIGNR